MCVFGLYQAYDDYRFRHGATIFVGEVVQNIEERRERYKDGKTVIDISYRPVVRFIDQFGVEHEKRALTASKGNKFQTGAEIKILFNRSQPRRVAVYQPDGRLNRNLSLAGIGFVVAVVSGVIWWRRRQRRI